MGPRHHLFNTKSPRPGPSPQSCWSSRTSSWVSWPPWVGQWHPGPRPPPPAPAPSPPSGSQIPGHVTCMKLSASTQGRWIQASRSYVAPLEASRSWKDQPGIQWDATFRWIPVYPPGLQFDFAPPSPLHLHLLFPPAALPWPQTHNRLVTGSQKRRKSNA